MSSLSRVHDGHAADASANAPDAAAAKLFHRAQHGDRGAFGQLVLLYQDRIYNALLRMIGNRDEAAELTQEAFTRGLANLDGFRGEAAPYTWLFRIAVNLTITRLRKVQRHRVYSLHDPGSGNGHQGRSNDQAAGLVDRMRAEPSAAMEQREQAEQVVAALGRIDPEQRAVLVMRDVEGFDYQQMADILELPLGTLKSRLFRARTALRDELQKYMNL